MQVREEIASLTRNRRHFKITRDATRKEPCVCFEKAQLFEKKLQLINYAYFHPHVFIYRFTNHIKKMIVYRDVTRGGERRGKTNLINRTFLRESQLVSKLYLTTLQSLSFLQAHLVILPRFYDVERKIIAR